MAYVFKISDTMTFNIETARLQLREFRPGDARDMYTLDADPLVHRYLGNRPISSLAQAQETVDYVIQQYATYGIGRWVVIEKQSGQFVGWSGLKFVTDEVNEHLNYYDVGYRLLPAFWGKGYATESARAALAYGFEQLQTSCIAGSVHADNRASRRVLEKCGLRYVSSYLWHEIRCDWLEITRQAWLQQV